MKIYCTFRKFFKRKEWAIIILPELFFERVDSFDNTYWYNLHICWLFWAFTISFYKKLEDD